MYMPWCHHGTQMVRFMRQPFFSLAVEIKAKTRISSYVRFCRVTQAQLIAHMGLRDIYTRRLSYRMVGYSMSRNGAPFLPTCWCLVHHNSVTKHSQLRATKTRNDIPGKLTKTTLIITIHSLKERTFNANRNRTMLSQTCIAYVSLTGFAFLLFRNIRRSCSTSGLCSLNTCIRSNLVGAVRND